MSKEALPAENDLPTPWIAIQRTWGYPEREGGPEKRLWDVKAANGATVVTGTIYGYSKPRACLVAAAPDMRSILDELEGAFDEQIYPEQVKEDFNAPDDREYTVTITAKLWRALSRALSKAEHGL